MLPSEECIFGALFRRRFLLRPSPHRPGERWASARERMPPSNLNFPTKFDKFVTPEFGLTPMASADASIDDIAPIVDGHGMARPPKAQVLSRPYADGLKEVGAPKPPIIRAIPSSNASIPSGDKLDAFPSSNANVPCGDELAADIRKQLDVVVEKLDQLSEKVNRCLGGAQSNWRTVLDAGASDSIAKEENTFTGLAGSCTSILTRASSSKRSMSAKPHAFTDGGVDMPVAPPPHDVTRNHVSTTGRDDVVAKALRERSEERKPTLQSIAVCSDERKGRSDDRKPTINSQMGNMSPLVPPSVANAKLSSEDCSIRGDLHGSERKTSKSSTNTGQQNGAQNTKLSFPSETSVSKQSRASDRSRSSAPSKAMNDALKKVGRKREAVISSHIRVRSIIAVKVWEFFEDPESSLSAFLYSFLNPMLVVVSVVVTVLLNVEMDTTQLISDTVGAILEIVLETSFFIEVAIRVMVCPNRLAFALQFNNLIDILSFVPLFLRASEGFVLPDRGSSEIVPSILFGAVPAIRLLKVLRYFPTFRLLLKAFKLAAEALPVMLYTLAIMGLVFSSMIYFVEDRSNVESLPRAMWLMIVTMTTVGYGDMVPQTTSGTILVAIMAISSVLYMAIPLGLMGNAFSEVWGERHKILVCQRARYCLTQWGYTADTLSGLFIDYDDNGDGELNLTEFRTMMHDMRVGLADKAITRLFETFDSDQSGFITDVEFVKAIFPQEYSELYANAIDEHRVSISSHGARV